MWNFLLFFSQYNFLLHFIPLEEFSSRNFLILLIKLINLILMKIIIFFQRV